MRVSQYFNLGKAQPELDFVDVDITRDLRVFVSPRAVRLLSSEWGDECVALVQHFFTTVLQAIRARDNEQAERLLRNLREPNETRLGLSKDKPQGRALGTESAHDVWEALKDSEAAKTGLLEDLEDTILMVDGISIDIVSDITTNIIREPLIRYTQEMCVLHGIPMEEVDSGPLWNMGGRGWVSRFEKMPVADGEKILLVPKSIVRRHMDYDVGKYYRGYLLERLKEVEFSANSELVHLLKNGKKKVTKKDLRKKYGAGKAMIVRETLKYPDVLQRYRRDKKKDIAPPLTHDELAEVENTEAPNWDELLRRVLEVAPGNDGSGEYEKAIEALLSALFYPVLTHPQVQHEIHEGRKRIDITYTNMASEGFLSWLSQHYPSGHIFVECKNFGREVGNPEIDQLSGRFSPSRGQVGLLVFRNIENKELLMKRCRDTALDRRGFIIPLTDAELIKLVQARKEQSDFFDLPLLRDMFGQLVM